MNLNIKKYHFARPSKANILEFAKRIFDLEAVLCFDFEDVVRDLSDKRTEKKFNRERIILTIPSLINSFISPRVGLRVNVFGSKEFFDDVEAIENIKSKVTFECIFLPKIKSGEEIQKCLEILSKRKIDFSEIIPIIENKESFNNLEKIVSSSGKNINKLAFGHCDYNYDNGNFPFFHQDSDKYWEWIDFMVKVIGDYEILFINSPYLELNNDCTFLKMLNRLSQSTNGTFGQITLSLNQLKLCSLYEYNQPINTTFYDNKNESNGNLEDIAKKLIKEYEDNISDDKSFSYNKEKRIIISPHEYLAANEYLMERNAFNVSKN
jgi:citrate lyase beta subunit